MQAFVDAFSGISGDMTVGALLDLGVPFAELRAAIDGLGLPDLAVASEAREQGAVRATKFVVTTGEPPGERTFAIVRAILARGGLAPAVRPGRRAGLRRGAAAARRSMAGAPARPSWARVHCSGDLSGRQRRNLVPWRNRWPEK
jgi:hypothetical protein